MSCGNLQDQRQLTASDKYLCPSWTSLDWKDIVNSCKDHDNPKNSSCINWWEWDLLPLKQSPYAILGLMSCGTPKLQAGPLPPVCQSLKPYIHFTKGNASSYCPYNKCNPIQLTITIATSQNSSPSLSRIYGIWANISEKHPRGIFEICFIAPSTSLSHLPQTITPPIPSDKTKVAIVEGKNLRPTLDIETVSQNANTWLEWIKYSIHSQNKNDSYAWAHSTPEAQIVSFPFKWSCNRPEMDCMVALLQDPTAWGNKSCQTLSLLFPEVQHPAGQPPKAIQPPSSGTKFTSC
uniref:Uncharacterized protein n=1 Tax=Papio anubis TaxID=9555 RepID=A0A8I5NES8_PAPAN